MKISPEKQAIIDAAFAIVYSDPEELIKIAAKESTVANLGQSLADFATKYTKPEHLVASAYHRILEDYAAETGDDGRGVEKEYKSWIKYAKKDVKAVQKKGLPLTLSNVRHAFEKTGPFAEKK